MRYQARWKLLTMGRDHCRYLSTSLSDLENERALAVPRAALLLLAPQCDITRPLSPPPSQRGQQAVSAAQSDSTG